MRREAREVSPAGNRKEERRAEASLRRRESETKKPFEKKLATIEKELEPLAREAKETEDWLAGAEAYEEPNKERLQVALKRRGEVAERYAYTDGAGEIGFVSSVSTPFCGDCHRARLSADGQLYTCLFAASGHDLRSALRAGANETELTEIIARLWSRRDDRYSELRHALRRDGATEHVEMYRIGG